MPYIDISKIPARGASHSTARVATINPNDPQMAPVAADIGAFRETCTFSHMSFDDPIVFPGQPGVSHLHTFFGNAATAADSTVASIANAGNSTCAGGILNRSAYWVPAMIDTTDGRPMMPTTSLVYYKTGYLGVRSADVKPMPAGLRMIAGDPTASSAQPLVARYACVGGTDNNWYNSIPSCPVGTQLIMSVLFPQCWDGVNLDSPDHKSHMAYAWGGCPSTHPVPLPEVVYQIRYDVTAASPTTGWRLSSDNYDTSKPGGYSGHADWFMGWDAGIANTFTTKCVNASMDCKAYLLGDGRALY
jgi:Domain of unknown function (DUF1996)